VRGRDSGDLIAERFSIANALADPVTIAIADTDAEPVAEPVAHTFANAGAVREDRPDRQPAEAGRVPDRAAD
jgi:hypothetical protein